MILNSFTNQEFTSNTYLCKFFTGNTNNAFLVDIGEYNELKKYITKNEININALFLTHGHYDHIYYINSLLKDFPNCRIFASEFTYKSLLSPKLNLSFYHLDPICYNGTNVDIIEDNLMVDFGGRSKINCIYTPGHNLGSFVFQIENFLFTGDSLIPGIPVVTKLPNGDKKQNEISIVKIQSIIENNTIICPGHGNIINGLDFYKNFSIDLR